jgi:hypothetical protein
MNNNDMQTILNKYAHKRLSPLKSIKIYCREVCSCGEYISWKNCTFTACPLFKYRLGHGNRIKQSKPISTSGNFSKEGDKIEGSEPREANI